MSQLSCISINEKESKEDFLDRCHNAFKNDLYNKNQSLVYNDKIISIKAEFTDGKSNLFLHISSLERSEGFSILPCNNTIYGSICKLNCIDGDWTYDDHTGTRDICIYRAGFVGIIKSIIHLANNNDGRIKKWREYNRKTGKEKTFIRYMDGILDYIIILSEGKQRYYIISAYPVFYYKSKKEFDRSYLENK